MVTTGGVASPYSHSQTSGSRSTVPCGPTARTWSSCTPNSRPLTVCGELHGSPLRQVEQALEGRPGQRRRRVAQRALGPEGERDLAVGRGRLRPGHDERLGRAVRRPAVARRGRVDVLEGVHRADQEHVVAARQLLVRDVVDRVAALPDAVSVLAAVEEALELELEPRGGVVGAREDEAQAVRLLQVGRVEEDRVRVVLERVHRVARRRDRRLRRDVVLDQPLVLGGLHVHDRRQVEVLELGDRLDLEHVVALGQVADLVRRRAGHERGAVERALERQLGLVAVELEGRRRAPRDRDVRLDLRVDHAGAAA